MPAKEKIGAKLKRLQTLRKHRDELTGFLYNKADELKRKYKEVTIIGLFVSDDDTFLIRPHLFSTEKTKRTPRQWHEYLRDHYGEILRASILPGMFNRTGKHWRLYRVVGMMPNDSAGLVRSKTRIQRNKTQRKRGARGRNSVRSR